MEGDVLAEMFELMPLFTRLRQAFDLTHIGTLEAHSGGSILWGIRRDEPTTLLVWSFDIEDWEPVTARGWASLTWLSPPFPWDAAGRKLVRPDG